MKNALILIIICWATGSFSQSLSLGIRTGYSYVSKKSVLLNNGETIYNTKYPLTKNNYQPAIGLNCDAPILEYISFNVSINFLSEGIFNGFEKSTYYRHYLQTEPNIRFTYNFKEKIIDQIFIGVGPEFTIVFNNKEYIKNYASPDGSEPSETYKNYEMGVCGGAGIKWNCGPGTLELTAQYGHGLTNVNRYPDEIPTISLYPNATTHYYIFYYYLMLGYSMEIEEIVKGIRLK